jgi:hypothetical protein
VVEAAAEAGEVAASGENILDGNLFDLARDGLKSSIAKEAGIDLPGDNEE